MSLSLSEIRDSCQQTINHERPGWYREFKMQHKCFSQFQTIDDFISFLHDNQIQNDDTYLLKDNIFRTLITEFQNNNHPSLLRSIFIVIFYPLLSNLIVPYYGKNLEREDLVSESICSLLKTIHSLKLKSSRQSLTKSISLSTRRDFWLWADSEINYITHLEDFDERNLTKSIVKEKPTSDPMKILEFFQLLKRKGVINDLEEYLLVGTKVYQQKLNEFLAAQQDQLDGLSYEAAKKRIQRAENKIKKYLNNS